MPKLGSLPKSDHKSLYERLLLLRHLVCDAAILDLPGLNRVVPEPTPTPKSVVRRLGTNIKSRRFSVATAPPIFSIRLCVSNGTVHVYSVMELDAKIIRDRRTDHYVPHGRPSVV